MNFFFYFFNGFIKLISLVVFHFEPSKMTILFVIQRVESASLLIDNKDKYVNINKGVIIHLSILKDTKKEDLEKIGMI